MKTLLFSPATFNLAETTRCIEVAKAVKNNFNIVFMSFGGQFEKLIEKEDFNVEKIQPRLTSKKIEHIYKVDQSEKAGEMFSSREIEEQVKSELEVIKKYKPSAVITGFDFAASISARVAKIHLIWLTQSTWDLEQMIKLKLGGYTDDFDQPLLRVMPRGFKEWLSIMMIKTFGSDFFSSKARIKYFIYAIFVYSFTRIGKYYFYKVIIHLCCYFYIAFIRNTLN